MAAENLSKCISLPASTNLSSNQYCFVEVDTNGQIAVSGVGNDAIGVLQDDPASAGIVGLIMTGHGGITKVKAGGTVTVGALAACDSSGRAVVATSGTFILGKFLEAGAVNNIVKILFQPNGRL